jgi:hypothetical protein
VWITVDNSTVLGIGGVEGQQVKGGFAGKRKGQVEFAQVSEDQMFNASRLSETAPKGRGISVSLIQKLNTKHGTRAVSDALRYMRLDPPRDPAAYLVAMFRGEP